MQYAVSRVYPNNLRTVWPKLLPNIRVGLRKGAGDTLTEQMLWEGVHSGEMDLWVIHSGDEILAGLILQVHQRERGKALVVLMIAAGTGKSMRHYLPEILPRLREYGEMIGAYTVESVSRPGAARLLSRFGCKPKAMIMELSDGRHT
jgi:hypothetical protein